MCFCNDIKGLFDVMNTAYDQNEWRLFIDGSKYSLKAALLHIGNKKPSIPIAHAVQTKECYDTMRTILAKIKYNEHQWKICGDLKVIGLLVGMQSGFTKFCCFLCLWDSRAVDHRPHLM
ncbi:uncharacterized protein LOC120357539 [Solenopsis invicta]|uniref:uncharacterized protein LOC120357539 n=1 Tax=Solenopsis invicta TaxID=13686 RepID=UPI00193D2B63|nr:uncharacterized protein LOC120357539 [Solenopsis invicta]